MVLAPLALMMLDWPAIAIRYRVFPAMRLSEHFLPPMWPTILGQPPLGVSDQIVV